MSPSHEKRPVGVSSSWDGVLLTLGNGKLVWTVGGLFHCSFVPVLAASRGKIEALP